MLEWQALTWPFRSGMSLSGSKLSRRKNPEVTIFGMEAQRRPADRTNYTTMIDSKIDT